MGQQNTEQAQKQYVNKSERSAALHKNPIPNIHAGDMKKKQKETGGTRSDSKIEESREDRDSGGGDEEKKGGGGNKKKNPLILPSQQTASGVPDRQFHWAGEVEHCSVSDLHSVYYAVTGAPRPRGGLLNCNMH